MQTHIKIYYPSCGNISTKNIGKRNGEKMWRGYIKNPWIHKKILTLRGKHIIKSISHHVDTFQQRTLA